MQVSPWFIAVVFVVIAIGLIVGTIQNRRKVHRLIALARQQGWHYRPTDQSLLRRYPGQPFGTGSGRRAAHVLTGHHRGAQFTAFEYRYQQSNGDSSRTCRVTVAVITLPAVRPRLEVTRESGLTRFLGNFGFRDLQLESEDFNRAFRIATDNDRFAYDVLNPQNMEWLLTHPRTTPFRFGGDHLITWRGGALEFNEAVALLDYVSDVRDRVPTFVWRS